jgi:hypothetical protein
MKVDWAALGNYPVLSYKCEKIGLNLDEFLLEEPQYH